MKYHIRIHWGPDDDYSGWVEAGTPCEALARGIADVKAVADIPTDPIYGLSYEVTYPTRTQRTGILSGHIPGEFHKRQYP